MSIDSITRTGERRFRLASGEIAAAVSGKVDAQLVIGIPGLSVNLRCFDSIFEALDPDQHRRLAFDPRGRGQSDKTPAGTYGWPSHVRDVLEMADELGTQSFDLIGLSMGAWIAMKVAETAPGRVRRMALIDAGGVPDESVTEPIYAGLERLAMLWPSRDAFMQVAQTIPHYQPWPVWQRLFDYELEDVEGGVRPRSQRAAALEDEEYRKQQDPYLLWKSVTMPALLVRATQPIPPDFGYVLTAADYRRFLAEVPTATGVEVDANHYTVALHPGTVRAITDFLR
ncbi:MAG: alpha/beta fold hydrolase [Candidatus Dormibacteria bacterium]